jgi:hypothetical protein
MSATIVVFTFDTTHQALWAEDLAREREIPVETAPAPPEAKAKCGIALRAPANRAEELTAAFREEGIEFGRLEERSEG